MAKSIPMTRGFVLLALAPPFATAGGDPAEAFEAIGLPRPDTLSMEEAFPAATYYALLEEMTRRLGDPFFPARAGAAIARSGLPVLIDARNRANTLGECLLRIVVIFRDAVTNAHYELSSDGRRANLTLKRVSAASRSTSMIDTLNAAAFVTLLRDELANASLAGLSVSIPRPADMPCDIVEPSAILRSREGGMRLSFPANWLLRSMQVRWLGQSVELRDRSVNEDRFHGVDVVRERVRARLSLGPVSLAQVARETGVSERRLQRLLRARGTSFRTILSQERLEAARLLLMTTPDPLGRIASACGFASQQALSRAFSAAFGQSPTAHRRQSAVTKDRHEAENAQNIGATR